FGAGRKSGTTLSRLGHRVLDDPGGTPDPILNFSARGDASRARRQTACNEIRLVMRGRGPGVEDARPRQLCARGQPRSPAPEPDALVGAVADGPVLRVCATAQAG